MGKDDGMPDPLSKYYADLLEGSYDCVDRIVLNAYFRMGHSGGGFRTWWQKLYGSDKYLDNAHLMRMAGRLSRRLRAFAKARGIPIIDCKRGERKHEIAEEYLSRPSGKPGLFLILISKAQAPVWEISGKCHLEWKRPMPYVNHYSFHIWDPEWGHVTIKISGHPPFPAQVILNGHEYVACQARRKKIGFEKEGNCFTQITDATGLAQVADTLSEERMIGRLSAVSERWIYTTCLCFALSREEQERSEFHYQYSVYQAEYSRNLLFQRGARMEQVFQTMVDRSRAPLGLKRIKTILGCKRRPTFHRKHSPARRWGVVVEKPTYDLTVFKVACGRMTLKIYTKGERVLRLEALVHNTQELGCGRDLIRFPHIVARLQQMLERFVQVLSWVDCCFITDEALEQLPRSAWVGQTRVGGIDLNQVRMRAVAEAVLALAPLPRGFSASALAAEVSSRGQAEYGPRRATYDLKKFRAKQLVHRIENTRRYEATPDGVRALTALLVLRDKVIRPLLAAARQPQRHHRTRNLTVVDQHYQTLRGTMSNLFQELGIAA
jgi:hypothetical protein